MVHLEGSPLVLSPGRPNGVGIAAAYPKYQAVSREPSGVAPDKLSD